MGLWCSLVSDTLDLMGESTLKQLDVLVLGRNDLDGATKHHQFWSKIDYFMDKASSAKPSRPLFETIKHNAPLLPITSDRDVRLPRDHISAPDCAPRTQIKISKGRRSGMPSSDQVMPKMVCKRRTKPRVELIIGPTLCADVYQFWKTLVDGNTKYTFTWSEFCYAMCGIGYTKKSQGGSGYRFEYSEAQKTHAIVFHEPHGYGDQTQPMRIARNWWLARMQRHVDLVFVE